MSGPVEGILTLCIVYALTAVKGGGTFWHQPMLPTLHVPNPGFIPAQLYDMPWTDWYMVYGGLVLVFNTISSAQNVIASRRSRKQDPTEALLGLLPFAVTWVLIAAYLYLNPTIMTQHMVPFGLYVGLVNAYSVGQMITAHLTKAPFPYWNVLVLPLLFGIADALGPVLQDNFGVGWPASLGADGSIYNVSFMFLFLGLAIGVYGTFVVDVIVAICDYLDIWCLTIKYPAGTQKKKN